MTETNVSDSPFSSEEIRLIEKLMAREGALHQLEIVLAGALMWRCPPLPNFPWPILKPMWFGRKLPFNPVEVVIFDRPFDGPEPPTKMIMTRRVYAPGEPTPEAEFWRDHDHFPGKYLGGREFMVAAIRRVVQGEIAPAAEVLRYRLITPTNLPLMVRNHDASFVFVVILKNLEFTFKPGVAFYPIQQPPAPLIPHHVVLHQRVCQWLAMYRRLKDVLPPEDFTAFDRATDLLESDVV